MTAFRRARIIRQTMCLLISLLALVFGILIAESRSQDRRPVVHRLQRGDMAPGMVANQLIQNGVLPAGHVQPVELHVPEGARISIPAGGVFGSPEKGPVKVGMLIGQVYRVKITHIPQQPGLELFPTIEVINRLCPPAGKETEYPIPIVFTTDELNLALENQFVTRVVYLENPKNAFPQAQRPTDQRYYEVQSHEDPLAVADRLGRPMAIMRIGSRVPDIQQINGQEFLYGAPPVQRYPTIEEQPAIDSQQTTTRTQPAVTRPRQNYPRVDLQQTPRAATIPQQRVQR